MDLNLEKKFSLYAKFKRYIDADSLFLSEYKKHHDPRLAIYYIENFLIPRNRFSSAAEILDGLISTGVDPGVRQQIDKLCAEVEMLKGRGALSANMHSAEFVAFRNFALNFMIPFQKGPLDSNCIEIESYALAKKICHDQNVSPPYNSWNAFRSQAAKEVYNFSFENRISLDEYDSTFPIDLSNHLHDAISGLNIDFFDDVLGDLQEIGRGIFVGERINSHIRMLRVYEAGYFPCGVRDDGKIMALRWITGA